MTHRLIRAGNHLYAVCPDCEKLVKMTGFFAGLHLCVSPDERVKRRAK